VKKALLIALVLIASRSWAQGIINSAYAFPSVNNAFLSKTIPPPNVSVDLYTGMAQASIPICKLAGRQLTIPVSVDYVDGRGVKVQEYASQVGLGWQLNAGGSISRAVRGFPDEMPNGYVGTGTLPLTIPGIGVPILPSGTHWGNVATTLAQPGGMSNVPQNELVALAGFNSTSINIPPTADGEPDLFFVKTPFFSFEFIFDQYGNPIATNNTGYKIISNFAFQTNYSSSTFEVIDDQGNQYWFGSTPASTEFSVDSLYGVPTSFISTWYLDKIVTYNSQEVITLTYQAGQYPDVTYNYSYSETRIGAGVGTTNTVTGWNMISQRKYVSVISSALGEIDFTYAMQTRADDVNAAMLTSATLKAYNPSTASNSTTLQTYNFSYSYFGLPSTDPNVLRLMLTGVTVTGNNVPALTVASFVYNTSVNLPNRTWMCWDYWGYCNNTAHPNTDLYGIEATYTAWNANPSTVQADILTNVYTSLGGMWQFNYEPNYYGTSVAGVRVSSLIQVLPNETSPTQTVNLTTTYKYQDQSGNASGETISALYTLIDFLAGDGSSELLMSGSPYAVNDLNGIFIGYSTVEEIDPNGGKTYYTFSNFEDPNDLDGQGFDDVIPPSWGRALTGDEFPTLVPYIDEAAKRGLLTGKLTQNANSQNISQTTYKYTPQTAVVKDGYGVRGFTFALPTIINACLETYYTPIENYRLSTVTRSDFDQSNPSNSVTTTTQYTYDPVDYRLIQGISTTESQGPNRTQTIYYSQDVGTSLNSITPALTSQETTALNTMVPGGKTGVVVHTIDTRNTGSNATVNVVHTTYGTGSNGDIYPMTVSAYSSDPANPTYTLAKQENLVFDPVSSQLISTSPVGGTLASTKYDYNTSLPVVRIVNASSTEYFYQGFEQSGGNTSTIAHTGNMCYAGSYNVPFTLPDSRSYLIQWWSYQGSWVFNQQAYTGPMTISGEIDDIRIFPKDALMTTYTYNPLVGKTSEIDPSGRTLTYQYDALNRLQTVFDQDGKVLKTYAYGVQVQASTGNPGLSMTGVPGYSSPNSLTGQGQIFGPPGYLVTVTMYAMGSPGYPCGLTVSIGGATIYGNNWVTNGTASFTFIMPSAGVVGWSADLVPSGGGGGGGDFSIK
jgi:YD repeat-containing protein